MCLVFLLDSNPDSILVSVAYSLCKDCDSVLLVQLQQMMMTMMVVRIIMILLLMLQLRDGKADIFVTASELIALLPESRYSSLSSLQNREILVVANVTEAATGTILSGNSTVRCTSTKYVLSFLDITPTNFKPGLTVSAFVRSLLLTAALALLFRMLSRTKKMYGPMADTICGAPYNFKIMPIIVIFQLDFSGLYHDGHDHDGHKP